MGWPLVRLGEVLQEVSDPVAVDPAAKYCNLGLYSYARGAFTKPPIDGAQTSARTLYRVAAGRLIYSRLFAFEGAYAVVPEAMDGYFVSNEYPVFEHDADRVSVGYLKWLLTEPAVWRAIAVGSKGLGVRRQRVHPAQVLNYHAPLPPLAEQQRIVARLDRVAGLVRARAEAAAAMEADLQAMLARAFARCIDAAPRRPMAEVAPLIRRPVEIEPDGAYPELGVRSFGRGTFHKPVLPGSEVGTKKLFEIAPGDLLFNIVFAWEGAVAIAQPADTGRVGSHRFLTCVPEPATATADFLLFYFQTPEGLQRLGEASPGGAGRNRTLGLKKLETIEVPLPPLETQRWFDRLQAKARQIRDIRAASARDTDALIPALLHQVFGAGDRAA
ncbi:restriction endonuclease subunit S [Paracoccus yeei]|uniref:restriction endonuclease subunit S n=1 Tax=Paracoccus yeei TaxID=147645 RepID=UPI003BF7BE68